ncbi:squalene-hopene/tetraprenyl-beta-curcumene cyclase/sporulenol synthase [Pseudomonas agarici]|nr:squalene-hopene/tetraprenyl-beta-curcumene cyclase/sporulenol synthase [Pseudomonas agarici]
MSVAKGSLISSIDRCVRQVSDHLQTGIDDRGAVNQRCQSRILESVLMLHLLRQTKRYPAAQDRLLSFLRERHGAVGNNQLDNLLLDAFLSATPSRVEEFVALAPEHLATPRKRWMLSTCLALSGACSYLPDADIGAIHYENQVSWVGMMLCAIKIVNACARQRQALLEPRDCQFLIDQLEHGSQRELWEGNLLAHLWALLALHALEPAHPLIDNGLIIILDNHNPDGGLPFISHMTVYLTAFAGIALKNADGPSSRLGQMADYLAKQQTPNGGWSYSEGVRQTDVDCTCCVIDYLFSIAPQRHARTIKHGLAYLSAMANPDGGFPTYRRQQPSEVTMTANALIAFTPHWQAHADVLVAALGFLLHAQAPGGAFERSWSLSETFAISRVVSALKRAPNACTHTLHSAIDAVRENATRYLLTAQHPDGGWGHTPGESSDVISSAHGLCAAALLNHDGLMKRGWHYLRARQLADGGFISIPDQAGPRPFAYDFPILANIFALNALAELRRSRLASIRSSF